MERSSLIYRDVTHDEGMGKLANHAPRLREALVTLGFERVGLLETRLGDTLATEPSGQFLADPTARMILQLIREGEVTEILKSPDDSTLAVVERWFGGPLVCLYTLVEDGVVVETTMKPNPPPQPGQLAASWSSFREENPRGWLVTQLFKSAGGTAPLWIHEHWPRSGYYLRLVNTRQVEVVWQEHRQRIEQMARRAGFYLRPHNSLALYLCIRHRGRQIVQQKALWQERLSWAIALLFGALSMTTVLSAGQIFAHLSSLGRLALLVPLAFLALAGSLAILVTDFVRGAVVPRLPGPRIQPVRLLLAEVEAAYPLLRPAA